MYYIESKNKKTLAFHRSGPIVKAEDADFLAHFAWLLYDDDYDIRIVKEEPEEEEVKYKEL